MSEKRFVVETVAVREKVITDKEKGYSYEDLDEIVDKLNELSKENEQLRQSVEYWQKKYEEGTETFQIN